MSLLAAGPGPLFIAPVNLLHGRHLAPPPPAPYSTSPVLSALLAVAVLVFLVAVAVGGYWIARRNRPGHPRGETAEAITSVVVSRSSA